MDDEGEEGDDFRNSTVPKTRRRIASNTSSEEDTRDERTVAVTTKKSSVGICEKAMRIASLDESKGSSGAGRWMVQFRKS